MSESSENLNSPANDIGWKSHRNKTSRSSEADFPQVSKTDSKVDYTPNLKMRVEKAPHSFRCPVAPEVLKNVDICYRNADEFKYLTYTPVTCQPEDFDVPENNYSLRQNRSGRSTEILVAITMYNEDDEFLIRTLSAVFKNLKYFSEVTGTANRISRRESVDVAAVPLMKVGDEVYVRGTRYGSSSNLEGNEHRLRGEQIWKDNSWQKIVVVIIADGRLKCHKRVLTMLQTMGVYQEEVLMTKAIDPSDIPSNQMFEKLPEPSDVTCHLYEYTCQSIVDEDLQLKSGARHGIIPVQMIFCLKERNAKKLNSHKWLFRGIAPKLNPYICILIDFGTRP